MPEIIHCPTCGRQLRVPEELLGKMVQCPECGLTFTAQRGAVTGEGATLSQEALDYQKVAAAQALLLPPAVCLLITGVLGAAITTLYLAAFVSGEFRAAARKMDFDEQQREAARTISELGESPAGIAAQAAVIGVNVLMMAAALAMLARRLYPLAVFGSILASVNFGWCCCLLGLPVGIWSLLVLSRPEVKATFR